MLPLMFSHKCQAGLSPPTRHCLYTVHPVGRDLNLEASDSSIGGSARGCLNIYLLSYTVLFDALFSGRSQPDAESDFLGQLSFLNLGPSREIEEIRIDQTIAGFCPRVRHHDFRSRERLQPG